MADGLLSGLRRRASELADDVGDRADAYGREGYRRARRGAGDTRGELRRLWSEIEDLVEDRVAPAAGRGARQAGEVVRETARSAGRYAADYAPRARDAAYDVADYLRGATQARPLLAIGLAIGATLLVAGMLTGSRRR
jgi:ElaB/YqjD/DUF883 family membrane-anchored ribosome-binding protein